jgi:lysine biosynthesis protein LysW
MVKNTRAVANCPDCQSSITLPPAPELWMRITCPECGTQLEIVDDNPWELDYAEDIDDDDDMDYEDFEEDDSLDDDKEKPWNT